MSTKWIVLGLRCQLLIQYSGVLLWWQVINSFDQFSAWSFSIESSEIERIFFLLFALICWRWFLFVNWNPPLGESIGNMSYFVCGFFSANPSLGIVPWFRVPLHWSLPRLTIPHSCGRGRRSWVLSAGDGFRSWAELREGGHPVGLNWIWSPENYI